MFDLDRVRNGWQREADQIETLTATINEHTAAEPVRSDGWTTHDLLGHIANSARGFLAYIRGDITQNVDIDAFNAQRQAQGRQRSWDDVRSYWQRTRNEVDAFLEAFDNSNSERPVSMPHLPSVQNAGDALVLMVVHTRSHRKELDAAFPPVQA